MFKQSLNRAIISLTLWPEGPLLVKTDVPAGNHAENADVEMFCVRTLHGPASETVYLPGSSLKGMLRAYCEAIARTIGLWCCPLFDEEKRCSKPLENEPDTAKRYRESCSICRTFGSTALASRMRIADAYPTPETWERANRTEIRNHVAIDRVLGSSAKGALFAVEVVTGGCFPTQITLENFELWQLGLLALALRDLEAGQIPMGYGKSRGMGNLGAAVTSVTVEYPGFVPVNDGKAMRRLGRTEPWSLQVAVSDDPAKVKMRVYGVGCFVD
ncbi:MAG TPA: hypothetical protein EYP85_09855, partial [Armatimonadetes bacterium]|nr:hypothetical protein [Armatimonadota bacterium]